MDARVSDSTAVLERLTACGIKRTERLTLACTLASDLYREGRHWSGAPLLQHVLDVLDVLLPFHPDEDVVIATLLHQVLMHRVMTFTEIEDHFGPKVRTLVSGVHLLAHVTLHERRRSVEELRLILLTVSDDVRIILMSLCCRCAVLRRFQELPPEEARHFAQDVLQLFAPVAARLGIYALKHELEERAFPILYPHDAAMVREQLALLIAMQGDFLPAVATEIQRYLAVHHVRATVDTRQKQSFSIFSKMRSKGLTDIGDLYDLFAVRVVVSSEAECYQTLGLLHHLGRPAQNRFKDYIAFPKPNGYQSLHTTLTHIPHAPPGVFVEVQIRTEAMHREAQYGIAAHWSYKQKGSRTVQAVAQAQLQRLLSTQQSVIEEVDQEALSDHIFVLTPHGDIVELPEGATPLDFAFQVHTDLGLTFRAARVNGSIVPLSYVLENGDVVEILKRKVPHPSEHWLQLLKTASSKSKLKRYLYAMDRPELVRRGKDLVNAELERHYLPSLDTDLSILRRYDGEILRRDQREDLLMKVGQGSEKASGLLPHLDAIVDQLRHEEEHSKSSPRFVDPVVSMEGNAVMPVRYAKCCAPSEWPRSAIAGVVSRRGFVMIHREECRMLKSVSKGRRIKTWWK